MLAYGTGFQNIKLRSAGNLVVHQTKNPLKTECFQGVSLGTPDGNRKGRIVMFNNASWLGSCILWLLGLYILAVVLNCADAEEQPKEGVNGGNSADDLIAVGKPPYTR